MQRKEAGPDEKISIAVGPTVAQKYKRKHPRM